jgi:hypothetical protein
MWACIVPRVVEGLNCLPVASDVILDRELRFYGLREIDHSHIDDQVDL